MNTTRKSSSAFRCILSFVQQSLRYVGIFFWALLCPKAVLAARLLAAESQLARRRERIAQKKDPRPLFTPAFRLLWVVLSKVLDGWELRLLIERIDYSGGEGTLEITLRDAGIKTLREELAGHE